MNLSTINCNDDLGQGYLDDPAGADCMEGAENKADTHVLCRYRRDLERPMS